MAQSSLILSGLVVYGITIPSKVIGATVGFGAGALISAAAFDLIPESMNLPPWQVAIWLLIGAGIFVVSDHMVEAKYGEGGGSGPLGIVVGPLWMVFRNR